MVLVTDSVTGKIKAVNIITADKLEIAENADIMLPEKYTNPWGDFGSEGNGLCFANHVHPYDNSWQNDIAFQELIRKTESAANSIVIKTRQITYDITLWLVDVGIFLTRIYFVLITEFAEAMPGLIDIFIMLLDAIRSLGGRKLKDEDGNEYNIDEMIDNLEANK